MSSLNLLINILSFEDNTNGIINTNPKFRTADLSLQDYNISIQNPENDVISLAPNASVTLFDGQRSTNISATTAFDLSFVSGSTYRIQHSGGTSPQFRTLRAIGVDATTVISVTINNNSVVTYQSTSGTALDTSSVNVGDVLFVSNTGFASVNQGSFVIIGKTSDSVSLVNYDAVAETAAALGAGFAADFKIFSSEGIQVGDTMQINAGFSPVTRNSYVLTAVTDDYVEFSSTNPLPIESGVVPGVSGLTIYEKAKSILFLLASQSCYINFDSDTSNSVKISPTLSNGVLLKTGPMYKAVVTNTSVNTCKLKVFSAEKL